MAQLCRTALTVLAAVSAPTLAGSSPTRVFPPDQAEQARQLAIRECKPLVIHFVPDNQIGQEQLSQYYGGPDGIPKDLLQRVVILVLPSDRFREFADDLEVTGPAGYRAISPFHLTPLGRAARPTCTGFR